MIRLIKNEIIKTRISKIIFSYVLIITSLIIINKYGKGNIFDNSYHLIPFIGIFVSILFSGSICFEIENGTLRYYLTKPFKRYKVYLSKIITILLYSFISYIIIVIITSLLAKSFDYDYLLKYLIHFIPIFFMSSFVMFLSISFKSHVLVSCISILTLCFSLTISQLLFGIKFNIIEYTFLPYLDFSIFNDYQLINNINNELGIHLNMNMGVFMDALYFHLLLTIGIIKFNKKDIKS